MSREEEYFKENFPEYVTEKGEFLSPYWDLFRAGVICATFELKVKIEQLTKAKEIIEKLISQNRKEWIYSDVREEAEQFLREIEK